MRLHCASSVGLLTALGLFYLHTWGCMARGLDCDRPEPAQRLYIYGTFNYTHRISTSSSEAQALFDQGMLLAANYNQFEARAAFRAALSYDPRCAMCWWGLAYARAPFQNKPAVRPSDDPAAAALSRYSRHDQQEAREAIAVAVQLLGLPPPPPPPATPVAPPPPAGAAQSPSAADAKSLSRALGAPGVRLFERLGPVRHCTGSALAGSYGGRRLAGAAAAAAAAGPIGGGDGGRGGEGGGAPRQTAEEQKEAVLEREWRYVAAMSDRLSVGAVWGEEWEWAERRFAQDMQDIAACWRGDADAPALAAEALANLTPWDFWDPVTGDPRPTTPLVLRLLNESLDRDPLQPLALHLHIHSTEELPAGRGDGRAGLAEASAVRLSGLLPAFDHLLHMPSHTFSRVGRWAEAAEANIAALRASVRGSHVCLASCYPDHNTAMLVFAAGMGAEAQRAEVYARVLKELPRFVRDAPASLGSQWGAPLLVWVRFAQWRRVLQAPPPPTDPRVAPDTAANATTAPPPSRVPLAPTHSHAVVPQQHGAGRSGVRSSSIRLRGSGGGSHRVGGGSEGAATAVGKRVAARITRAQDVQKARRQQEEAEEFADVAAHPHLDPVLRYPLGTGRQGPAGGNGSSGGGGSSSGEGAWGPLRGPLADTEYTADGAEFARVLWHFARVMALAGKLAEPPAAAAQPPYAAAAAAAAHPPSGGALTKGTAAAAAPSRGRRLGAITSYNGTRPHGREGDGVANLTAAAAAGRREVAAEFAALRAAEALVPADVAAPPGHGLGIDVPGYKLLSAVLGLMAEARLAVLDTNLGAAAEALSRAVDVEASGGYFEPPRLGPQPARQCLGWVLLRAGRLREALQTYLDDLSHFPDNPWSIRGLHAALPPAEALLEKQQAELQAAAGTAAAGVGAANGTAAGVGAASTQVRAAAVAITDKEERVVRRAVGNVELQGWQMEVGALRRAVAGARAAVGAASAATLAAASALRSSCLAFSER